MPAGPLFLMGAVAVFFAALMFFQRTLYASALCFLVVLAQLALVYYWLGAELLAYLQVMIYAGAIMVLVVTAATVAPPRLGELWAGWSLPRPLVFAVLLAGVGELAVLTVAGAPAGAAALPAWPSLPADFSSALFGRLGLLTEALGIMILLCSLAAVEVWRRP